MQKKALIIDDDLIVRTLLMAILQDFGYETVTCENGKEAWQALFEHEDTTLIITDMMMPDMDGREFVQLLRHYEAVSHLPVIIVSGTCQTPELLDLLKMGPTTFCPKPVTSSELKKHILQHEALSESE